MEGSWNLLQTSKKTKLPGWTTNPLAVALISAVLAGIVSFLVASYQVHASAEQAIGGQQATAAAQVETAATAFYHDVQNAYKTPPICHTTTLNYECTVLVRTVLWNDLNTLGVAVGNVSDPVVHNLEKKFSDDSSRAINDSNLDSSIQILSDRAAVDDDYSKLMTQCGRIIQGRA